jgi:chromate transporter
MFLKRLVEKRRYLTEAELFELQALCQILPGPTSTQTITALGFKIGGPSLAYLTLLIWALPAVAFMTAAAIGIRYFEINHISLAFTRFIEPIAIGFLVFGGLKMGQKLIKLSSDWAIMIISGILAFIFHSPWITPLVIILGGLITAQKYREQKKMRKLPFQIEWANFSLWLGVLIFAAVLGIFTATAVWFLVVGRCLRPCSTPSLLSSNTI